MEVDRAKCGVARAVKDRDKAAEARWRAELATVRVANFIERTLAEAPPLSTQQRNRLVGLIRVR